MVAKNQCASLRGFEATRLGVGSNWYDQIGVMDMMIGWLVILVALGAAVVWFLQRQQSLTPPTQSPPGHAHGLGVLEERYARGEIDRDEYLEKKGDLGGRAV